MDKNKSYVAETIDLTDTEIPDFFTTLYKLKFDFYEIYARQFKNISWKTNKILIQIQLRF